MLDPESSLERARARLESIADKVLKLERSNELLRSANESLSNRISSMEDELLKYRPRSVNWGWLWWTLMRPEVVFVRVRLDGQPPRYARNSIYSGVADAWKHTGFDASISRTEDGCYDVSRGRSGVIQQGRVLYDQ